MLATFYLTQRWVDNRLEGLDEMVQLGGESYKDIWQPYLFLKGRGMRVSTTMKKNAMSEKQLTLINTTGLVTQTMGCVSSVAFWFERYPTTRGGLTKTELPFIHAPFLQYNIKVRFRMR